MEYRIEELNGVFTIQVKSYETNFFFWWIKKWGWSSCNMWGDVRRNYPIWEPPCAPMLSLKEAQDEIKRFKSKPIYHNEPF